MFFNVNNEKIIFFFYYICWKRMEEIKVHHHLQQKKSERERNGVCSEMAMKLLSLFFFFGFSFSLFSSLWLNLEGKRIGLWGENERNSGTDTKLYKIYRKKKESIKILSLKGFYFSSMYIYLIFFFQRLRLKVRERTCMHIAIYTI